MSVMRPSDGKLTDKIYTDENLLGVKTTIDVLQTFMGTVSQGASSFVGSGGQSESSAVTTGDGAEAHKILVNIG